MKHKFKRTVSLALAIALTFPMSALAETGPKDNTLIKSGYIVAETSDTTYAASIGFMKYDSDGRSAGRNEKSYIPGWKLRIVPPSNEQFTFALIGDDLFKMPNTDDWRFVRSENVSKDLSTTDSSYTKSFEETAYHQSQMDMLRVYWDDMKSSPLEDKRYKGSDSFNSSSVSGVDILFNSVFLVFSEQATKSSEIDQNIMNVITPDNLNKMKTALESNDVSTPVGFYANCLREINSMYFGSFDTTKFETNYLSGNGTVLEKLGRSWNKHVGVSGITDEPSVKREFLQYLFYLIENYEKIQAGEDEKHEAGGNTGSDTKPDSTLIGGLSNSEWNNWYISASKIARGVGPSDTGWNLGSNFESVSNLVNMNIDDAEFWLRVYDILCVAYSKGETTKTLEWDNEGNLRKAFDKVKEYSIGKGLAPTGVTTYQTSLEKLNSANTLSTDMLTKRMSTFYDRITSLYHVSTLLDVDFTAEVYSWITDYYENDTGELKVPDSLFPQDKDISVFLQFDGTRFKGFPALGNNEKVLPYMIQTLWEIPYIMEYKAKDFNDAISNSTVSSQQSMYDCLSGVKKAVDELGMPALTYLWEADLAPNETFKSMKSMWEAAQNDPSVSSQNQDNSVELVQGKPLAEFISNYDTGKLSDDYIKAIAYTSTLVPMKSNLYSSEWWNHIDADTKNNFYYQWAFNRKALYRDTSSHAGESYYTSGKVSKGDLKVCTLRDMLDAKDDLVLYLDDNFYNADQLKTNMEYTEPKTENTPWYSNIASSIEETFNTSFDNIVKTGPNTNYSKTFYDMMSKVQDSHVYYPGADETHPGNTDNIVLNSGKINYYLDSDKTGSEIYSPLQAYAVVSSVYRDGNLFTLANSTEKQRPVFIASKTAPYAKGASTEAKLSIYNYALLKNLKASMPIGYVGNLDMDCPVYMDILGNIVTESGTVVVPAVSNATIMNHDIYNKSLWGAGLFSIYGEGYRIPIKFDDNTTVGPILSDVFVSDPAEKYYVPAARVLGDNYSVDMSRLSTLSKDTMSILYERVYNDLQGKNNIATQIYDFDSYFQICLEVMRGAPIENIDKVKEGIDTSSRVDRAGIVAAAKLEELNNSLNTSGENSVLALPNIAFMQGFNYVALLAFKLLLLIVVTINMITIVYDTVGGTLSFRTFLKCLWAMILTMAVVITVPAVFNVTYYQSNRALLQDEASSISMFNLEKSSEGVEVGVTEVTEPSTKTQLYLKLETIEVPWWKLFYNSSTTDAFKSLNSMYSDYAKEHSVVANNDDVEVKNDGVYIDVADVYNSSSVDINKSTSNDNIVTLVQTAQKGTSTFSFYSPYYAILDALIENVNYFNAHPWGEDAQAAQGWYSYATKSLSGGKLKTMGLIEPYFTSSKFMEDDSKDPLGFREIYKDLIYSDYLSDPAMSNYYSQGNLESMRNSYWYPTDISPSELDKRVDYLVNSARDFVSENKDLLGKISDETFLKAMALNIALKHNKVLNCEYASTFEISNLSSDDLIRLSIAGRGDVITNSSLSFPRFVYAVGGAPGVYASAVLSMIMWFSGIVKPLLVLLAFGVIFVSIFVLKVCRNRSDISLYGYFITVLLLCATNIVYSLILKLSLFMPKIGMTPFMCIIIQIIIQIAYLVLLLNVVWIAFKDWHNLGMSKYMEKMDSFGVKVNNMLHSRRRGNSVSYGGSSRRSTPEKNWEYYDKKLEENERRKR